MPDRAEEADDPTDYSPSEAFAKEAEEREKEVKFARMEAELDQAYEESARAAAKEEPPPIVQALVVGEGQHLA